ncbi:adenosinetriphosphatase [Blastomyces gilchristii SLH14081]|uniref:RNA helicase n=1 Tax=Blastomyces gilchristii (strain SLH14081) TaxID=559298 RepID=A0A179UN31_BLAGS|nr:adenosinetriphosphatase [Blastomyces gilchristii SLH14081]OAT09475.1 adenosinetriphosphatase [Blastomyces gilchristii SLH14081]
MPKFVPRQRKHKNKLKETNPPPQQDTNVIELAPVPKSEKEEKRRKLREELRAQQPKISGKKQKRLDKYIETKLKKDENLILLKKLADAKIDTSQLQSSRNLGKQKGKKARFSVTKSEYGNTSVQQAHASDNEPNETQPIKSALFTSAIATTSTTSNTAGPGKLAIGSGLKRPLELGEDGFPVMKKRKRAPKPKPITEEPVWDGFESDRTNDATEDSEHSGSDASDDEDSCPGSDIGSGQSDSENDEDDEQNDQSSSSDDDPGEHTIIRPRSSAFKAWAVQQINEAVGFKPTEHASPPISVSQPEKPATSRPAEDEPLPAELQIPKGDPNRKAFAVQVNRPEDVQASRLGLPVVGEEQKIMEAIHNNPSVVIWGATGSGKTTQLPQFLFEAGYGNPESPNPGMIGITQPRRVAAVSMAKRVADELGQFSDQVSYQIRFDSTVSSKTAIKFMTDGVLIREIAQDFSLSKYSIIIIDEAHERSVNTDILIGMVSRIVDLRKAMHAENPSVKPLKLVIMSATLRISDFLQNENLFRQGRPPLVQAEGRQYPVTIHFSRRTHSDYVEEAFRKVSKGHRKLPPGAFLVFLTGQAEIKDLAKRLKQTFRSTHDTDPFRGKVKLSAVEAPLETEDIELGTTSATMYDGYDSDIEIIGLDDDENDDDDFDHEEGAVDSGTKVHVLPLYSQLPTKEQMKVFEPVPEGSRLIVLATNVAETSLTIPGIRYVFDCGRSKEKQYDVATGVQSFRIGWISKASASQRAGRAGRTGPGHCYRLYSSAVFEGEFEEYTQPEILRTPIEGVVLQMKSMGLHHVINFPFPTPPNRTSLAKAEKLLRNLGALTLDGQVTDTGRHLSLYPLSPRFGKMLQIGHQHGCMPYAVALVSALAVSDLFVQENQLDLNPTRKGDDEENKIYTNADRLEDTAREMRRKDYNRARRIFSKYDDKSDALKSLAAVCAYAYATDGDSFCSQMFLRPNAMKEASQLRRQLYEIVRSNNPSITNPFESRLPEPTDKQLRALKQITAAGFIDHVAIRADMAPVPPEMPRKPRRAIDVPYLTLFSSRDGYARELDEKAVYIHPTSVLSQLSTTELPQYLIYSHLQQSAPSAISDTPTKVRMFPLTAVSGLQLSALGHGTPLIEYGKPIGKIEPVAGASDKRECWVIPSLKGDPGSTGWPLPAKKVVQRKDRKHGWVIEKFIK